MNDVARSFVAGLALAALARLGGAVEKSPPRGTEGPPPLAQAARIALIRNVPFGFRNVPFGFPPFGFPAAAASTTIELR
jgi:hypothetical protein